MYFRISWQSLSSWKYLKTVRTDLYCNVIWTYRLELLPHLKILKLCKIRFKLRLTVRYRYTKNIPNETLGIKKIDIFYVL